MLDDPRVQRILFKDSTDTAVLSNLVGVRQGAAALTRAYQGEPTISAVQRVLIFLGYSTASDGAYVIDGDFGRGTNRGVAQCQHERGLPTPATRAVLCYACSFKTAREQIVAIPDVQFDGATLDVMLQAAADAIAANQITFGDFEAALFHLNAVQDKRSLSCRELLERYGDASDAAIETLRRERNVTIRREWILAIVKQETGGVVRPRFEQHILSQKNTDTPDLEFAELRLRSTSFGLGQVMGFNFEKVGAPSARAMLSAGIADQVGHVARFLASQAAIVSKANPTADDFRALARYYNGPAYASQHYHERLETWFNEFRMLLS